MHGRLDAARLSIPDVLDFGQQLYELVPVELLPVGDDDLISLVLDVLWLAFTGDLFRVFHLCKPINGSLMLGKVDALS